jgi:hypothetical protein
MAQRQLKGQLVACRQYVLTYCSNTLPLANREHFQLIAFTESAALCRHVVSSITSAQNLINFQPFQSICHYFDEPIDETNQELVKTYCNRMCDVGVLGWKPIS